MKKLIMLTLTSVLLCSTVMADTFKKIYQEDEFGKFYNYLMQSIKYPNDARLQNHQGNSIVTFTLLKGNLKKLNIETALGNGCDVTVLNSLMGYERLSMLKDGKYALKTSFRIQGINSAIVNENAKMPIGFTALKTITIIGYPSPNAQNKSDSNLKSIKIIGYGSGSLGKEPLYVLDGKVLNIRLKDLDANDIESLTVLKDASAISLYGKEAENGVIVINTKKARASIAGENILKGKVDSIKVKENSGMIRLRGDFTDKDPLYILDGKVIGMQIKELNPDQIESISILKDASAISLYGKEAENGAVVIKTKKAISESVNQSAPVKNEEEVTVTGYGNKVVLRGDKTFGNEPLFILDGKIMENGSLNDVEPNKVKTVEILKNASAIALYGPEAHNGVIIITTKKEAPPKTNKK